MSNVKEIVEIIEESADRDFKEDVPQEIFKQWREKWRSGDNKKIAALGNISNHTVIAALRDARATSKTFAIVNEFYGIKVKTKK